MNGAFVSWCATEKLMTRDEVNLALRAWNAALYYAGLNVGRLTATEQEGPVPSRPSENSLQEKP